LQNEDFLFFSIFSSSSSPLFWSFSLLSLILDKVKAMKLTDQLEVTRRGWYSGGFGGISFSGDMDIALALRTIIFPTNTRCFDMMFLYKDENKRREWAVHIQAEAGIVADSDPGDEQRECENKAAALVRAIDLAESSFVEK
jgi:anthranilate synthase component 1